MSQHAHPGAVTASSAARACSAFAACALLFGAADVVAKPPTCSITSPSNDPVNVTAGGSADFQGLVTSGAPPYDVTWTFQGGNPASASDSNLGSGKLTALHSVSFASAGTFTVTMAAQDSGTRGNTTCSATRTIQVGGGTNNSPVAQDDEYNTTQGTTLTVDPPGVLSNDNDPDGDPMTAVLVSDVTRGSLSLHPDGGFDYTPDAGYSGTDFFTYTANDAGGASNVATVLIGVSAEGHASINSTSAQDTVPGAPVGEGTAFVKDPAYAILAINDLGMHCGDLDTRISSILPPFNVLHSQVIVRGNGSLPRVLGEGQVGLTYSAVSNPDDPAPSRVASGQTLSSVTANGEVYKTNFWNIAFAAYDPFYPSGILGLFYDSADPANNVDIGLPVPDVERFYLEDGFLSASQQAMPGSGIDKLGTPYASNDPQAFEEHIGTLPFFINFPFGYTANLELFEAAGVPIAPFDDFGQENPYPLVRVQAEVSNNPVATVDIVMPISGEASCQSCHADPDDGGNGKATNALADTEVAANDPLGEGLGGSGDVPSAASIEWAADKNILKLHDQKHGTTLITGTTEDFPTPGNTAFQPVVCQRCHYTPALDLAQLGPLGPENDRSLLLNGGTLPIASLANGRDQVKHKSMSNAMHSHHGSLDVNGNSPGDPGYDSAKLLLPLMPPAIDGNGARRDPITTQTILEQTCYLCHPGKRTACMRGAMANGGLVCQDCHGQILNVGNDFSRSVSPISPGTFELAADFYTNPATPRVPWANEPSCGSCHTGYATDNLAGDPNVLVNPADTDGNTDNIRLLAAYRVTEDPNNSNSFVPLGKAAPIVPTNKAFAENVVTVDPTPGDDQDPTGNPKLYRVSTGHGGLMCEGCHGSTHAEWPVANPNANENVPSKQIQGHRGYIAQCQVCHEPNDASLPLGNNGPHGMHAIADLEPNLGVNGVDNGTNFAPDDRWNLQHRSFRNQGPGCESCHGADLRGTVLSRTADERTVTCKDNKGSLPGCAAGNPTAIIPKGTPVGCGLCHRQK